jgi:cell division protein FtsN
MAREGRTGIGIADRLVIVLAWMTTCGLVYVLGFYVGKGAHERSLGLEDHVVRLPVTSQPPPEGQRPKSESEFVFYDKLMGERGDVRPVEKREAAKPVGAPAEAAPARPTPATATAPARPTAAAPEAVAPPAPKPAAARPAPAPNGGASERSAPAAAPPAAVQPAATGWTVLANPTRSRDEADGLARQLRARGYEATLVRVVRDRDTWYRVQVGRFASSDQATEMMHRLRDREGVSHAFVASQ